MKKDIYKESMNHIRFNNNFEEETLKYCKNKEIKKQPLIMKRFIPVAGALAAMLCFIAANNTFSKGPTNIPNTVNTDSSVNQLDALYVKNLTMNNHQAEYKLLSDTEVKALNLSAKKGNLLTETEDGMKVYQIADRNDFVYILIEDELYQFFSFTGEDGSYQISDVLSIYGINNISNIKTIQVITSFDYADHKTNKNISLDAKATDKLFQEILNLKSIKEDEYSKQIVESGYVANPGDEFKEREIKITSDSGEVIVLNYNPLHKHLYQGGYAFFNTFGEDFNSWLIETAKIDINTDYSDLVEYQNIEGVAATKILEWVNTNGYPDYYAGVYINENGKTVILLTDDSNTNKEEIIKIASSEDIIFQKANHSYHELNEIQDKISEKMQTGEFSFITSSGVIEDKNYIEVGVLSASDSEIEKVLKLDPSGTAIKIVDSGNLSTY